MSLGVFFKVLFGFFQATIISVAKFDIQLVLYVKVEFGSTSGELLFMGLTA